MLYDFLKIYVKGHLNFPNNIINICTSTLKLKITFLDVHTLTFLEVIQYTEYWPTENYSNVFNLGCLRIIP